MKSQGDFVKLADWPKDKNWGTLTFNASCTPTDITSPTDLNLLNEERKSSERIMDDLGDRNMDHQKHRARYDRNKAGVIFLGIAKHNKHIRGNIKAIVRRKLDYLQQNLDALMSSAAGL